MGKIIAVITDFSKPYWQDFKKAFNNKNTTQIDVLIFNNGAAQATCIKDNHIAIKFAIDDEKSVVLIKQANPNINQIRMGWVLNQWCRNITEIGIAAHANNGTLNVKSLTNDKSYHDKTFHHYDNGSDPVWEKIVLLFNKLKTGEKNTELFNALWAVLAPSFAEEAHKLRAEVLTPFMPFHLYHQLDNKDSLFNEWKGIFKDCCKAINDTEKKLREMLNMNIPDEIKKQAEDAFKDLRAVFSANEPDCIKAKDCRTAIENFADCLEDVVNSIESGESAS